MVDGSLDRSVSEQALRTILKNQHHAALAMLRQAIELCPDNIWSSDTHRNPFWRIAYHILYFVHLYLQPNLESFSPWQHHQTGLQYLDDMPGPLEVSDFVELPHRPPQTGEPYTKAELLEYWGVCDNMIDQCLDRLNLLDPESGFYWYKLSKLEHQIISIRHTQHHAAQLADRVRGNSNTGIDWVSSGRSATPFSEE
jgi:hypothetical protein